MIITCIAITAMVRYMVDSILDSLLYILSMNHIVLPPPGWRLEAVKFLITLVIISPIIGVVVAA